MLHSAKNGSAKVSLPSVFCRALDKDFAECPKNTRQTFFEKKAPTSHAGSAAPVLDPAVSAVVEATEPDPRRHRAREGVWAHAAMLSDSVAAFPALDPRPPSLPWIHAAVLSERGTKLDPTTPLAPALAAASAGGVAPPWIRNADVGGAQPALDPRRGRQLLRGPMLAGHCLRPLPPWI